MKVLGIDPGFGRMGVAVLDNGKTSRFDLSKRVPITSRILDIVGKSSSTTKVGTGQMENGKCTVLYSDCVETLASLDFGERLGVLGKYMKKVLKEWRPERVAIEKLFFTKNQKTGMQVAETRGMILHICQEAGLDVREYTPQQIKVAVTGSGRASKTDVADMLPKLVKMEKKKRRDDEYDAIAIALTNIASVHS